MNKQEFKEVIEMKTGPVIFKLGASWCGPCQHAIPIVNVCKEQLPTNVTFYEIDVDKSLDVYGMLKSKKMVSGIPSFLCYYEDNTSLWPDEAISTSKKEDIEYFFKLVTENA